MEPSRCRAADGVVTGPGGKSLTFGAVAEDAARLPVPTKIVLKKPSEYRLIGKPLHRLDSAAKVNGTAKFGINVQVPGMVTVVISRCRSSAAR